MAITYQHGDPATMRSTLAVFFAAGTVLSTISLVVAGEIGTHQWQMAGVLLPAVLLAALLGPRLRARLPEAQVRAGVLAVCALSAVGLVVETVVF